MTGGYEYTFYILCVAEVFVVTIGFLNIPAAAIFQVLILLALFRNLVFSKASFRPVAFVLLFVVATAFFSYMSLLFRHTFIPLLLLSLTAAIAVVCLIFSENRIVSPMRGST
jgi:hypothetical protein